MLQFGAAIEESVNIQDTYHTFSPSIPVMIVSNKRLHSIVHSISLLHGTIVTEKSNSKNDMQDAFVANSVVLVCWM